MFGVVSCRLFLAWCSATADLPQRVRPQDPPQLAERRLVFSDPRIAQPYVSRSYLVPERDTGDQVEAAKLTMLAELLGGNGATSVLGKKLLFNTQQAVYASAYYDGGSIDDTTFGLVMVPTPGTDLKTAEAALDKAVSEFLTEGVDAQQFERIKFQIKASQIYAEDDIQSLARRYGEGLSTGLTIADIEAWPDILMAVTEDDVMEAAHKVFDRRNAVTGWLMPSDTTEMMQ